MKTIKTLQELADFINANDDWSLETEKIIKSNGWISDCGTQFGICHHDNQFVSLDEAGKAIVTLG